jgi:signal transduction histidine kinase
MHSRIISTIAISVAAAFVVAFVIAYAALMSQARLVKAEADRASSSLINSFNYHEIFLRSTRSILHKYDMIRAGNMHAKEKDKPFEEIQNLMLQNVFGSSREYYLIRTLDGNTSFELRRGALRKETSAIRLEAADMLASMNDNIMMSACAIEGVNHLCLVDIPNRREFLQHTKQSYSVLGFTIADVLSSIRLEKAYVGYGLIRPTVSIQIGHQRLALSGPTVATPALLKTKNLGAGVAITSTVDQRDLVFMVLQWALITFLVIALTICALMQLIAKRLERESDLKRKLEIANVVSQVAHDIRSPLAALEMVASSAASDLPEDTRVILRNAASRIKDIANDLLSKGRAPAPSAVSAAASAMETSSVELLIGHIESMASEKRMQYRSKLDLDIETVFENSSYGAFALIQPAAFKRLLSNLINNAVESFPQGKGGRVTVSLCRIGQNIRITVTDNGVGIQSEHMGKIGNRGVSYGKNGGHGLGLYSAKETLSSWGGRMAIESTPGQGTSIVIYLAAVPAPAWFAPALKIRESNTVVVLDDDSSVHSIWLERLQDLAERHGLKILNFSQSDPFVAYMGTLGTGHADHLFLMDYEIIGCGATGLDLIERFGIEKNSILITSRGEEQDIIERCTTAGVCLLPKSLATMIPIHCIAQEMLDAVLIDDDSLTRKVWEVSARKSAKRILSFDGFSTFTTMADTIHLSTPIYIDDDLGEGLRGYDLSAELAALGFANVYLATGRSPEDFPPTPNIRGVIGKSPPWMKMG